MPPESRPLPRLAPCPGWSRPRMLSAVVAICVLVAGAPAFAADYVQAAGSALTFASRYQGEVFTGHFPDFHTRLSFDPRDLASARLDVLVELASASTANEDRDETLHGPDFFHSSRFAQARYEADRFRHLGGNEYAADGMLTLHGVSRPVTLSFTWKPGARPVMAGKATVRRLEFGIGAGDWADTGLIPDAVAVSTRVVLAPLTGSAVP